MRNLLIVLIIVIFGMTPAFAGQEKSLGRAILLSVLMPGAGELYLGYDARAKALFVSEGLVWATFAGFRIQGHMREDRYKELAEIFAGVRGEKDEDFYRLLSHYVSSEDYNVDVMREARLRYPDDRAKQLEYFEANAYFGDDAWQWDDLAHMDEFEMTRTRSRQAYRRAVLTTGFAVLNRLVSVIDVYLSYRLDGDRRRSSLRLSFRQVSPDRFECSLSKSF